MAILAAMWLGGICIFAALVNIMDPVRADWISFIFGVFVAIVGCVFILFNEGPPRHLNEDKKNGQ